MQKKILCFLKISDNFSWFFLGCITDAASPTDNFFRPLFSPEFKAVGKSKDFAGTIVQLLIQLQVVHNIQCIITNILQILSQI
jgi:hypothetical protein